MAGVKWIRIDTQMFENPKLLYLKEDGKYRAIVAHLEAMAYSGAQGLGGFLPKAAVKRIDVTPGDIKRLIDEDLWQPVPGGWQINDWAEYQLTGEEIERRSERGRKAAAARWNHRPIDLDT